MADEQDLLDDKYMAATEQAVVASDTAQDMPEEQDHFNDKDVSATEQAVVSSDTAQDMPEEQDHFNDKDVSATEQAVPPIETSGTNFYPTTIIRAYRFQTISQASLVAHNTNQDPGDEFENADPIIYKINPDLTGNEDLAPDPIATINEPADSPFGSTNLRTYTRQLCRPQPLVLRCSHCNFETRFQAILNSHEAAHNILATSQLTTGQLTLDNAEIQRWCGPPVIVKPLTGVIQAGQPSAGKTYNHRQFLQARIRRKRTANKLVPFQDVSKMEATIHNLSVETQTDAVLFSTVDSTQGESEVKQIRQPISLQTVFKCPHCTFKTVKESCLHIHVNVNHGDKPTISNETDRLPFFEWYRQRKSVVKCQLCAFQTIKGAYLAIHEAQHHGTETTVTVPLKPMLMTDFSKLRQKLSQKLSDGNQYKLDKIVVKDKSDLDQQFGGNSDDNLAGSSQEQLEQKCEGHLDEIIEDQLTKTVDDDQKVGHDVTNQDQLSTLNQDQVDKLDQCDQIDHNSLDEIDPNELDKDQDRTATLLEQDQKTNLVDNQLEGVQSDKGKKIDYSFLNEVDDNVFKGQLSPENTSDTDKQNPPIVTDQEFSFHDVLLPESPCDTKTMFSNSHAKLKLFNSKFNYWRWRSRKTRHLKLPFLLCGECPFETRLMSLLTRHDNVKHSSPEQFDRMFAMLDRLVNTSKDSDSRCEPSNLVEHLSKTTKDKTHRAKPSQCPDQDCGKTFASRTTMQAHARITHPKKMPHAETTCGKLGINANTELNASSMMSRAETMCRKLANDCNTELNVSSKMPRAETTGGKLGNDVKPDLNVESDNYVCMGCIRKSLTGRFSSHEQEEDTVYGCEPCAKRFKSQDSWIQHMESRETKVKTHVCDVCDREFRESRDLECHQKTHAPDMPLFCGPCQLRLPSRHATLIHMERHLGSVIGDRPKVTTSTSCINCRTVTVSHPNLVERYVCPLCDVPYDQWKKLRVHLYDVHEKRGQDAE